jgi:type I restriction enzyme, R subunit
VVGIAKKADDLPRFLKERKSIIVTTQQKFAWVLEEIKTNPELKKLRVAFLIDEAHRSQEGQMGAAIRLPFRKEGEPDEEAPEEDLEEQIAKVIREHDLNQLFVAFTATPAPATVSMFGKPFDTYTEAEAIAEGYIVDVAASIISFKTLYNLHCPIVPKPDEEALYIRHVTEEKIADPAIRTTVQTHRDDFIYLDGPYRGQVNEDIQTTYDARGRYDELADPKYTDTGGIFDIMAVTVIQTHLALAA